MLVSPGLYGRLSVWRASSIGFDYGSCSGERRRLRHVLALRDCHPNSYNLTQLVHQRLLEGRGCYTAASFKSFASAKRQRQYKFGAEYYGKHASDEACWAHALLYLSEQKKCWTSVFLEIDPGIRFGVRGVRGYLQYEKLRIACYDGRERHNYDFIFSQ